MILNSIGKMTIFSIRKCDLILNLFIWAISVFTLCNLVNNDLDNAFGGSAKEPPLVYDQNL
ncbi:MAG TPA: hypothetical protein VHJ38_15600, partial [Nitrososphaeraceae archaeon]|nr:hypothetical protein [Nitrososphaeraceae archaeon]